MPLGLNDGGWEEKGGKSLAFLVNLLCISSTYLHVKFTFMYCIVRDVQAKGWYLTILMSTLITLTGNFDEDSNITNSL